MPRPHLSDPQKLAQARARSPGCASGRAQATADGRDPQQAGARPMKVKLENDRCASNWLPRLLRQRRRARSRSCDRSQGAAGGDCRRAEDAAKKARKKAPKKTRKKARG